MELILAFFAVLMIFLCTALPGIIKIIMTGY